MCALKKSGVDVLRSQARFGLCHRTPNFAYALQVSTHTFRSPFWESPIWSAVAERSGDTAFPLCAGSAPVRRKSGVDVLPAKAPGRL